MQISEKFRSRTMSSSYTSHSFNSWGTTSTLICENINFSFDQISYHQVPKDDFMQGLNWPYHNKLH